MRSVRKLLLYLFWGACVLSLIIVILYESHLLSSGSLTDNARLDYFLSVIMELLTLMIIPFALWFFRLGKIRKTLIEGKEKALRKWGILRLSILIVPMLVNILYYYWFMNPAFGYLAIILFICLFFVYPTWGRCMKETQTESH